MRRAALAVALLGMVFSARALDLYFNDTFISSRPVVSSSGLTVMGDILPPLMDAWDLEIDGVKTAIPDLESSVWEISVRETGAIADITYQSKTWKGVKRVRIRGEVCPERELSVWVSWEGTKIIKEEALAWASRHGIKLDILDVPSVKAKLETVNRGGGIPADIVMVQADYISDLRDIDALQPLDSLRVPDLAAQAGGAFALSGSVWAIPFYCDTQLVFYNPALVSPVPKDTWKLSDLTRIARSTGVDAPFAFNAYSAYWILPFFAGYGMNPLVDKDGNMFLSRGPAVEALQWLRDAALDGDIMVYERDAMMSYFRKNRAAFILSGSYSIHEFRDAAVPFGILPLPVIDSTGLPMRGLIDYKGFAISKKSRHPLLARRFISLMLSPGVQERFPKAAWKLPATNSGWAALPVNALYATMRMAHERGLPIPTQPSYAKLKDILWKLLRLLYAGGMKPEELAAQADKLMRN